MTQALYNARQAIQQPAYIARLSGYISFEVTEAIFGSWQANIPILNDKRF